jgi:probable rRNA maturation factor
MVIMKKAVPGVSEQALARFIQQARKATGLRGKVNVVLTSSRDIRALNLRFRGHDEPTDVLSFPPIPAVAARNARLYQHAPAQELKILILHGMLHLAGFDHEQDRGRMARQEERFRRELGLTNGLIRRTEARKAPPRKSRRQQANDQRPTTNDRFANDQRPTTNDRRRPAR